VSGPHIVPDDVILGRRRLRGRKRRRDKKGLVYFRRLPLSSPSPLSLTSWSENEISKCDFKSYLVSLTKYGHEQRPIIDELSPTSPRKEEEDCGWFGWSVSLLSIALPP
jgi:hypothetical protein